MDFSNRPNRTPWPPLIYGGACLAAVITERLVDTSGVDALRHALARPVGFALLAVGLSLDVWAVWTLTHQRTAVLPHRAASRLVTSGPFGYSRNPIYLGNTLAMIGVGLAWSSIWFPAFAFVSVLMVRKLAVEREEAHMAASFGEEWHEYRQRVRRWL